MRVVRHSVTVVTYLNIRGDYIGKENNEKEK